MFLNSIIVAPDFSRVNQHVSLPVPLPILAPFIFLLAGK